MESWFHILKAELVHHTGGRKVIIAPDAGDAWAPSRALTTLRSARWRGCIGGGGCSKTASTGRPVTSAEAEGITLSFVNRLIRRTLLAPAIVEAILEGMSPKAIRCRRC